VDELDRSRIPPNPSRIHPAGSPIAVKRVSKICVQTNTARAMPISTIPASHNAA
jgi:hypothetical protein